MKKILILTIIAMTMLATLSLQRPPETTKTDILSWPGMPVDEFGCMMEKTFGHRDERFNCSLENYENHGGPCDEDSHEYYEGPKFPEHLAKQVHPWMKSIDLFWERGMLQHVSFKFDGEHTEEQILSEFKINPDLLPRNIIDLSVEPRYVFIQGFWHEGAADVGCGDDDDDADDDDEEDENN